MLKSLCMHTISSYGFHYLIIIHNLLLFFFFFLSGRDNESRQFLSRKVPIPPSMIYPYRVSVIFRLVILVFFLRYRLTHPVHNAYGLWLASVFCEVWFSVSWILDQLPKWQPVNRQTFPERLCMR